MTTGQPRGQNSIATGQPPKNLLRKRSKCGDQDLIKCECVMCAFAFKHALPAF